MTGDPTLVSLDYLHWVSLAGDFTLLPAGLLFTLFLWRRRGEISEEFRSSWRTLLVATLVMNLGFFLNLAVYLVPRPVPGEMGVAVALSILQYTAFLLTIALFLAGIRQWYPLVLAVQREANKQAAFYRKLVNEANSVFLRWDTQGRVLSINPYGEKLFGYSGGELVGRNVVGSIVPERDTRGQDLRAMIRAIERHPDHFHHNENENMTRDGRWLWLAWRNTFVAEGLDGRPEILSVGVDITDRKRAEDALHALATASQLPGEEGIFERTVKQLAWAYGVKYAFIGTFVDETRSSIRIESFWDGERIGQGKVYAIRGTPCADVLRGRIDHVERDVARKYPQDRVLQELGVESYYGAPLRDTGNTPIGILAIMDTRPLELPRWNRYLINVFAERIAGELLRRCAEENIYRLAHYDTLTGLPNRLLFQDRLEQALAQARRNGSFLALLFIDLDHFKHVNDTLGHAGGDILLREVAGRIGSLLRKSDTVARLGGDEFTVLMTGFHSDAELVRITTAMSREVIQILAEPFRIDGTDVHISASVGITCFPTDGSNLDYLVRNADLAMYKAKERGRNCYEFYRPELNELAERRSRLETELRRALDNDELRLAYQPIVDVVSGRVAGFEALVRWNHPAIGQIPPGEFIEMAEYNGLVVPIGEWVIRQVCRQLAHWDRDGVPVPLVSINISLRQLQRGGLIELLEQCVTDAGTRCQRLMLEITESVLMHEPEKTLPLLETLRARGYRLAMDDFGTGYSSFGQLRQMPVRTLKIDRSFVEDLDHDENSRSIVSAIIGMGQGLGLEVIAEGVETGAQKRFLAERQCNLMQGYHFSHPLTAEQCPEYAQRAASGELPWQRGGPAL